jgi:hypothetical protein
LKVVLLDLITVSSKVEWLGSTSVESSGNLKDKRKVDLKVDLLGNKLVALMEDWMVSLMVVLMVD